MFNAWLNPARLINKNTRLSDSYDVHDAPLQPQPVCYTAPKQPYPQK